MIFFDRSYFKNMFESFADKKYFTFFENSFAHIRVTRYHTTLKKKKKMYFLTTKLLPCMKPNDYADDILFLLSSLSVWYEKNIHYFAYMLTLTVSRMHVQYYLSIVRSYFGNVHYACNLSSLFF